jgi:hypothetical protein
MGTSFWDRVANRRAQGERTIRGFLADLNGRAALNAALRALQSEAATSRRHRGAGAGYLDAELAAEIFEMAFTLHNRIPVRPEGADPVPAPEDLLLTFTAVQERERPKHGRRHAA